MDIVTHGLAGMLVARAGFEQRIGGSAMIALVAGAILPDVDAVMVPAQPSFLSQPRRPYTLCVTLVRNFPRVDERLTATLA